MIVLKHKYKARVVNNKIADTYVGNKYLKALFGQAKATEFYFTGNSKGDKWSYLVSHFW